MVHLFFTYNETGVKVKAKNPKLFCNELCGWWTNREGVGTSNFRTTTGQLFQNVEVVFLVYQNVESQKGQNVENVFWVDHYHDDQNVENSIKNRLLT